MASHLRTVLVGATHVERGSILLWGALRGGLIIGLLTTWSVASGHPRTAVPLAVGAILAALADAGQQVGRRWRTMAWVTLWIMASTLVAVLISDSAVAVVIASTIVALGAGVAGVAGPRAALGGVLTLVTFTVFAGAPELPDKAIDNALLVGLGGIIVIAAMVLPNLIMRPAVMRAALETPPGLWSRIRPQLRLTDPFVRHGVRLAIAMAVTTALAELSGLAHAYWLPMTIAWVTKPDAEGTVNRVAARTLGTLLGLAVCAILLLGLGLNGAPAILACALAAGLTIAFVVANYAIAVASITVLVVMVFNIEGDAIDEALGVRLGATLLAALIAVLASYMWRLPDPESD